MPRFLVHHILDFGAVLPRARSRVVESDQLLGIEQLCLAAAHQPTPPNGTAVPGWLASPVAPPLHHPSCRRRIGRRGAPRKRIRWPPRSHRETRHRKAPTSNPSGDSFTLFPNGGHLPRLRGRPSPSDQHPCRKLSRLAAALPTQRSPLTQGGRPADASACCDSGRRRPVVARGRSASKPVSMRSSIRRTSSTWSGGTVTSG